MTVNYNRQGLESLRVISALAVVIYHFYIMSYNAGVWVVNIDSSVNLFFENFRFGSQVFLLLLGYFLPFMLLKYGYLGLVRDRFFKIYPVFLVSSLLLFVIGPVVGYSYFENNNFLEILYLFGMNLILVTSFFDFEMAQKNTWFLGYYFFGMFYFMFFYYFSGKFFKLFKYRYFAAMLATFLLVILHFKMIYFVSGLFLYWVLNIRKIEVDINSYWVIGVSFFMYFCCVYLQYNVSWSYTLLGSIPLLVAAYFLVILPPVFWMKSDIVRFMAKISYSLYIWHSFVFFVIIKISSIFFESSYFLLVSIFVLGVFLSVLVAYFSYLIIEVKLKNYLMYVYGNFGNSKTG